MKRYLLTLPALIVMAACADNIVGPVQSQNTGSAAASGVSDSHVAHLGAAPSVESTPSGAIVLDFESLAASGSYYTHVASYSQDGFTLVNPAIPDDDWAFVAPESEADEYQGSTALANNRDDGVTLLQKDDGAAFTVASIDVAELDPTELAPRQVSFTGTRADGSTVTATFTTDGLAGFETFVFAGFTNIVSLSWVQASPYHQFDNITLELGPQSKDDCWHGGWSQLGFANQGQCIRMVETGTDSR